jgi:hypothetical protein
LFTEFIFSSSFSYNKQCIICVLAFLCLHTSSAQAPTVRSFFPVIGGQSSAVQISGRNFTTATAVSFGGTAASFFFITSDTSIVAFVDTGSSGAVAVTNLNGTASLAGFTFVPPPVITSINPNSGAYGDTIRIRGQHFINVYSVSFGDSAALSFNVLSDTLIRAVIANGQSGQVTISTIGGYGTITDFTYTGPAITSFTPTKGTAGTIVQIKGVRFAGATAVSFGEIPATAFTVNADTMITATVGSGGPGYVKVKTPKGTAAAPGFIVPLIKSFDPQGGTKYTVVTIKGFNFTGISSVNFGDSAAASFTIESDTVIKAVLGNGNSGSVTISNGVYTDAKDYFFYFPYYPTISSFSPDTAAAGAVVTIRGSHFRDVDGIAFGNTPAASFTVVSDTVITAVVGNGSSGYVFVAGNNATDSLAGFVYSNVQSLKLCPPAGSSSIITNLSGTTYQWQLSLNAGASFSNISNNTNYSGVTTNTLQLNNIPSSFNGNIYRCIVNGTAGDQSKVQFVNNWTGAISNLWSNTGNWSCGVLPDANTDVTVNSGVVVLNVNGTCRSVLFAPGTSFTANAGFKLIVTH